ncbi:tol-pal system-associated acyl-CoA thioesterase [Catenovulum sp. SM1970]|uniref:tol-pal system-associated acyl-CoA thioesterase n=1 Tax=Marinifaba aquimaris TaxID=2741323 RepID=UPI0015732E89|nr:tol-pal system-associated acyl-CoA thioesterase [Marinifaba aquimaris]NTS78125.1 tol-pal system-associated acyl-CoA thioesterase [Marinifaba aquimaris]
MEELSQGFIEKVFHFPVRVYYEDTDAGGIVYHTNYLKFYERARTEMLSALGIEQDILLKERIGFVVRRVTVDNIAPAQFNARLQVKTEITELKKVSVTFNQSVFDQGKEINRAEFIIASINLDTFRPVRLPENIIEEFKRVS